MSNTSLEEIFSTESTTESAEPAAVEPTPEVTEDVTGKSDVEASTDDKAAIPAENKPVTEVDQLKADVEEANARVLKANAETAAFKTKALDEVNKRQDLQKAQVEKPDAYVEPDNAIQFAVDQVEQKFEARFLNLTEAGARSRHDDFDEMKDLFINEMANDNPVLAQQALAQQDPHEWIYQQAKHHNEFKDVTSMDDLKAKIEADIEAKYAAKYAEDKNAITEKAITDSIPGSLATSTAAGGNQGKPYSGPMPFDKIFPT